MAISLPQPLPQQLTLIDPTMGVEGSSGAPSSPRLRAALLSCPSFKVRCVRGHWPTGIVGDIGAQPFKRVGIRCNQAHIARNTRMCNFVFEEQCEGQCEAYGPIPF
ncbi:BZ3500_MvSof-1268-A1-R1_Chr1-1g00849 [Microbotryum saponariae]|uniref:BZ3500_MvSof-1268-A1-R1_Chr1-1g00849 protein n=1 Tax=Microbotryum saponariae TaxID=289078 RepID=A0A2X0MKI3_9BASI|nr:BZ3500_MvSof-1268-A1-R1_Chr1-1g00849 [Microbotryum saponariae]SCZ92774.1 BZ3501_MvSof-1269-A2-R1_Chr1-1g00446 [Microbotryum saponariae]